MLHIFPNPFPGKKHGLLLFEIVVHAPEQIPQHAAAFLRHPVQQRIFNHSYLLTDGLMNAPAHIRQVHILQPSVFTVKSRGDPALLFQPLDNSLGRGMGDTQMPLYVPLGDVFSVTGHQVSQHPALGGRNTLQSQAARKHHIHAVRNHFHQKRNRKRVGHKTMKHASKMYR